MVLLLTLEEILQQAEEEGLGEASKLRRRFVQYQQYGLLGSPVEKQHRRGGSGLWHPVQSDLFQCYLRNIREGVSRAACANVPIGLWLMGEEGVETTQAQRALQFMAGRLLPPEAKAELGGYWWIKQHGRDAKVRGDRSDVAQDARELVNRLSLSSTSMRSSRGLQKALRRMAEGIPEVILSQEDFVNALQATNPTLTARGCSIAYHMVSDRMLALSYLPVLCSSDTKVLELWERLRRTFQWATERGRSPGFRARLPPDEAMLFPVSSSEDFLSRASGELLSFMGLAIRGLRGDRMVSLQRLGLDSSYGRLFA